MEDKIQQIKIEFNKIKDIRNNVAFCFNALENKLTKLKTTTTEFVKNNKHNIFIFGLDSFQFQSKLIDYEYSDMKKFYLALNNRMYCEYYKLYKIILQYTEDIIGTNKNIVMLKSNNIFPIYKDLEPLKQYNFDIIEELHKTIVSLLNALNDHILFKESQLQLFQKKQKSGLNINNFVNTFDFDVVVIKQKCLLFLSYLDFFHTIHTKHFKRFSKKMKLMNDYLDEDIKFDEELQHREDDSLKSSASMASFDFNEDENIVTEKPSIKSLFKSNVSKIINTLKIATPNNKDVDNTLSPVKKHNINDMLNSLSQSFDHDINDVRINKYENVNDTHDKMSIDIIDAAFNSLNKSKSINENKPNIVSIYDTNKTHITSEIMKSIDGLIFEDTSNDIDTINVAKDSSEIPQLIETNDNKNDDVINSVVDIVDTIKDSIDRLSLEELDEGDDVDDTNDSIKDETNVSTNKKKKKKKKK